MSNNEARSRVAPQFAETMLHTSHGPTRNTRIVVVVEGVNDIEFLKRISAILRATDDRLPDLRQMEIHGELIFIPFGGGHVSVWTQRLASLGLAEFYLYDREITPETEIRREAAQHVNARQHCRAVLTQKRSLENYLHWKAIRAVGGIELSFGDFDSVPELVAKQRFACNGYDTSWEQLSRRGQKRFCYRAKRWLNTQVVDRMTPALLAERDLHNEVASWLQAIRELSGG